MRIQSGEAQISVTHTARQIGTKQETLVKREDVLMAQSETGEIQKDDGELTTTQLELPEQAATVSVGKKLTMNIGNYESVAISVHLSMPCSPEKEAVNDMYKKVNKWIDGRIEVERDSVRKAQSSIR